MGDPRFSGPAQWMSLWHGVTGHTAFSFTEPPGTRPLTVQDVHAPQLELNEHMAGTICSQEKGKKERGRISQQNGANLAKSLESLGTQRCQSEDLRRKSWEPHMGWGGGGGHPRDDAAQWEFRPRWASACNWQSSCPVSVHASRKNLANKTPCFEELILLTRIERYFTEKELAAGLIFTLTYILVALASKGISLNASPSWLVGHRFRQCPGTPDKKEE